MKKTLSLLLALVMLLTAIPMAFTSCSDGEDDDPGADIHLFLSNRIYDLDPTLAMVDDDAAQVLSLLYEPLFKLNADGSVGYALAKSYKIDKANREMTITLRKTYWSDSKRVPADDVVYAWKRILNPNYENPAAALLFDVENALYIKQGGKDEETMSISTLGVKADGVDKLVISFRKDLDYIDYDEFLRNLTSVALAPVPENTIGTNPAVSDNWSKRVATIVTNGPFTLSALAHLSGEFALQRNQYYRRSKNSDSSISKYVTPQLLSTTWQTMDMSYEEYEKFLTENVIIHFADDEGNQNMKDSFYFIGELPIAVRASDKYAGKVITNDLLSVSSCVLNMTAKGNPALQNAKIRQALSLIVDRDQLAKDLVYAKAATGFVTPGVLEPGKKTDFRTDANALIATGSKATEAKNLIEEGMQELGYTDKAQLGELRLLYSGESINDGYTAKVLKAAWESLGFTVILDAAYGQQRTVANDVLVLDSVLQMNFNSNWSDCRVDEDDLEKPEEETEEETLEEGETVEGEEGEEEEEEIEGEEGEEDVEGEEGEEDFEDEEQEEIVIVDTTSDVMLIDYQMLATNALATLAGFALETSGNGYDKTDISSDGSKEYSYSLTPHVSGYNSEAYNALIDAAYNAKNAEERAAALHEAEELLLQDMPVIPLVFNQDYYLISDTLTKITANEYGMPVFTKAYQKGYKDLLLYGEAEGEDEDQ